MKLFIFFKIFFLLLLRYGLTALIVVYFLDKRACLLNYKTRVHSLKKKQLLFEMKYSILSMLIFSLVIFFTVWGIQLDYFFVYVDFNEYSIFWTIATIPIVIVVHDFYFYFWHLLLHQHYFYKNIHYVHHRFREPSIFSTFCFHPIEAFIQVGIFPLLLVIFPLHLYVLILFGLISFLMNVYGHFGYDFYPDLRYNKVLKKILNTSTHHYMHHKYNRYNYSLYLNYLDFLMNTNHKKY